MFDWSRGALLKAMQQAKIPDAAYDPWLKGFAYAWLQAVLEFQPGGRVLDVGCGAAPTFVDQLRQRYGVEAHGLDKSGEQDEARRGWGLGSESRGRFPNVTLHDGFAGEEVGPEAYFDGVLSVSALEHIYDTTKPVDAAHMFPHFAALRDMARMTKPGGILAFTYDFPLCYPYNPGWSPVADFEYVLSLGFQPCCWTKTPPSETFVYNHADTLFVQADGVLGFCDYYFRIAIFCFAFLKPGSELGRVRYRPDARIAHILESGPAEYPSGPLVRSLEESSGAGTAGGAQAPGARAGWRSALAEIFKRSRK